MKSQEERYGKSIIRIVPHAEGFRGVVIRDGRQGPILEDEDRHRLVARLRNEAGRLHPDYVGFEGAIARFRTFFPDGFQDASYIEMERAYKVAARKHLIEGAPLQAVLAQQTFDLGSVRKAYQTNMLSPFEAARISQVLRSDVAEAFVQGAAQFSEGQVAIGLASMIKAVTPHGRPSWPIVTYLPFYWQPDRHMFLKPEKTVDFATRVGHRFADDYSAELEPSVYESLQDLAEKTETKLRSLKPADRIDIQSFIWVVGDYGEGELPEANVVADDERQ